MSGAVYRSKPDRERAQDPDFISRRVLILDIEEQTDSMTTYADCRTQMKEHGLTRAYLDLRLPQWTRREEGMARPAAMLGSHYA